MSATTTNSVLSETDSEIDGLDGVRTGEPSSSNSARRIAAKLPGFKLPLIAGILLLSVGLGAVGYGFFQLVITDIVAARAQDQLEGEFAARLDETAELNTALSRDQFIAALDASADDPTIGTSQPEDFDDADDVPVFAGAPGLLEPVLPQAGTPWVYEAPPNQGDAVGRIIIPDANVDWLFVEGVTQTDLRQGPGHMPHTALPGQFGNAVISGHRTTYGAPFFDLDQLEKGDRITVKTVIGTHIYEVIETRIVQPTDVWVTEQWGGSWLTLTTCNPQYSARERLIVFSRLISGPNATSTAEQFGTDYVVPDPPSA